MLVTLKLKCSLQEDKLAVELWNDVSKFDTVGTQTDATGDVIYSSSEEDEVDADVRFLCIPFLY